ncbi:Nuclear transcription factor Y subunit beta [Ceratocystis lukuohia]|uniref:Nuclear transcription factor Y subunit beta n=1 Tax=Ceratocystis lukuohia TaxID=2019550 RepID=A0ABR4MEK3_9PEZI
MSDSPQSQTQNQNQSLPPTEAEHAVHDAEVDEQMNEGQEHPGAGLGFDFEVKEQDRWLPIANDQHNAFLAQQLEYLIELCYVCRAD